MKCNGCNDLIINQRKNKKFCSEGCRTRFNAKRYYSEKKYIYRINNKKRYNALMKRSYLKNKLKFNSRASTYMFLKTYPLLNKSCKNCGINSDKLQINHEIYPNTFPLIKEAIIQSKIYYLCIPCHYNIHPLKFNKSKDLNSI